MQNNRWAIALLVLISAALACNFVTGAGMIVPTVQTGQSQPTVANASTASPTAGSPTVEPSPSSPAGANSTQYKTEFPLPPNITNFTDLGNGAINFQAKMNLKDTIAFYRGGFAKAGYKEREINTAITDTTFSMVFDGHPSGKAIVIQGVDLGGGSTNVNIRFEKL